MKMKADTAEKFYLFSAHKTESFSRSSKKIERGACVETIFSLKAFVQKLFDETIHHRRVVAGSGTSGI